MVLKEGDENSDKNSDSDYSPYRKKINTKIVLK